LPRLSAPQFSLRTLLLLMAAASVLFAVMAAVGARWSAVLVWFLVLISLHVVGNFWGSKVGRKGARLSHPGDPPPLTPARPAYAPSTRLRRHAGLATTTLGVTGSGSVIGGLVGGGLLWSAPPGATGLLGFTVGTGSAAVVGGFLGFLASSFLDVTLRAFSEASRGGDLSADAD
jgi:hypothetical protein